LKFKVVWDGALMMEAARTSEMSVDVEFRTRQHIPEDSEIHARRRENQKSHINSNPHGHLHDKNLLSS
jgi:hypothetical protein